MIKSAGSSTWVLILPWKSIVGHTWDSSFSLLYPLTQVLLNWNSIILVYMLFLNFLFILGDEPQLFIVIARYAFCFTLMICISTYIHFRIAFFFAVVFGVWYCYSLAYISYSGQQMCLVVDIWSIWYDLLIGKYQWRIKKLFGTVVRYCSLFP